MAERKACSRSLGDPEEARVVALMLTRRCNMTCAHCSVISGPRVRDEPAEAELVATLHAAADAGIRGVLITGGEPMIREKIVFRLMRIAKKRGLFTMMSTNGFWGRRQPAAWRKVAALKRAGLVRLTVSYDRYHAEFQGPGPALNIARAAEWFDVPLNINITRVANDPEIATLVAPFEERHQLKMRFYDVQHVGRARELPLAELRAEVSGYCTACFAPALTDDGRMTACNGPSYFLGADSPLVIGSMRDTPMPELLQRHTDDPILQTIRRAGPARLLRVLEDAGVRRELGIRSRHSGLCDLCIDINSKPAAVSVLRERLSESRSQAGLAARRMVLRIGQQERSLGIEYANGAGAVRLWMDAASGRFDRFDGMAERILGRADFDWNRSAAYLTRCGMARGLAGVLNRRSLTRWAPSFFVERVREAGVKEGLHELTQREILRRLSEALASIGERGVALKGGALIALDIFGKSPSGSLARRAAGDIDLYVSHAGARALRDALLARGFSGFSDASRTGPHHLAPVKLSGVSVEIHTSIMPAFWGLPETDMLGRACTIPGLDAISTLDAEGMILHALTHCTAHLFSFGMRAAWDVVWIIERYPHLDVQRISDWAARMSMPRAFWVPARVLAKGVAAVPAELLRAAPHDERQRRLECVADARIYSAIEEAFDLNPISKHGFFLMLHDSPYGKARHIASLFGHEERESRRTAARSARRRHREGNHSALVAQVREGMTHWRQFRQSVSR